jgi:transcriptional regulator with XRE-family HTH domain
MARRQTIQQIMKAANITQSELAERLGVKQPSLSRMLSPKSDPKLSSLMKLAKELGTTIEVVAAHYEIWNEAGGNEDK